MTLNLATVTEGQRQDYATRMNGTTSGVLSLHLQDAANSQKAADLALTTLLRRKGRVLDVGISSLQNLHENLTPEDQALLDELTAAYQALAALTFDRPANLTPEQYRTQLAELEATVEELESTLARRSAAFRVEVQPVEIEAVQAQIPDNAVLIEYIRYQSVDPRNNQNGLGSDRYAVYLLFPNGQIEAIDLGDAAEVDAAIESFNQLLQNRSADLQRAGAAPTIRTDVVEQVPDDISTLVFDPIAPHLRTTDHLLISPDGQLNLLPFEALQPEPGGDYLIQHYQISYLNSGRDLLKFDLLKPSTNPAVIIANPDYDTAADVSLPTVEADLVANGDRPLPKSLSQDGRGTSIRPPFSRPERETSIRPPFSRSERETSIRPPFSRPGRRGWGMRADQPAPPAQLAVGTESGTANNRRSTELGLLQVGPLPGTAAEAEAIRPLLPNANILTETAATENLLKSVQSPRILHIATHGFFLENIDRPAPNDQRSIRIEPFDNPLAGSITPGVAVENPLLRSGLALAGFNTRTSGDEDGVFTALEASQLNLSGTQLVVLSACDTGLGDISNGEGVYGLRRAFAIAGAESQLMSLWQVSDFGTQSLMARYYENLTAGMGRSEALREVQLEMIEQGGQYSHPYYWAAFILAGDWRSLPSN
ncbi:MAG: CHAT domain-containing protein [Cyanothece sp. SIO2G6]|nr:CHAT domain-containing protein [Cyanothece sp. SIO2G6]